MLLSFMAVFPFAAYSFITYGFAQSPPTPSASTIQTAPSESSLTPPVVTPEPQSMISSKPEAIQSASPIEATPLPAPNVTTSPQTPTVSAPSQLQITPTIPPTSLPAVQPPSVSPSPAPQPLISPRTTLLPNAGDSVNVDTVMLPAKPVAILKGRTTWDNAFAQITASIEQIDREITKHGLQIAGRPLTYFITTDDNGFTFEVMRPIDKMPVDKTVLSELVRLGTTPEGKAMRFVHKGPYEEVDSTYEALTAYLDAKGVAVQDSFLEEYVSDLIKGDNPELEINIFVQPKDAK